MIEETPDLRREMKIIGYEARQAARVLARAPTRVKNEALNAMASAIRGRLPDILAANRQDRAAAGKAGRDKARMDRLVLDESRVEAMAVAVDAVSALPDPVGECIAAWTRPNGLRIERVRTPLGVIGAIFRGAAECDGRRRGLVREGGATPAFYAQARIASCRLGRFCSPCAKV